jgi:hypothetical protein
MAVETEVTVRMIRATLVNLSSSADAGLPLAIPALALVVFETFSTIVEIGLEHVVLIFAFYLGIQSVKRRL